MIKNKERVYQGFMNVDKAQVQTKSGKIVSREISERGNAVCAILYNPKNNSIILTSQYRVGSNSDMLELVAGSLKDGEDPFDCIVREILEETGYESKSVEKVCDFYMSPGGSSEKMFLFYVVAGNKIENGGGLETEDEEIDVVEMPVSKFKTFAFNDAKTLIGQLWFNK